MSCDQYSNEFRKFIRSAVLVLGCFLAVVFHVEAAGPPSAGQVRQPGNSVKVNFGQEQEQAGGAAGILQVVASGVGIDEDKAMQNALSNAIEQAVGVMVDARTLVENDEIVSDKVLTFSRGFIDEFSVVRRWEADGLHRVRVRARVSAGKLSDKLTDNKISVRRIPGELLYYQAMHDIANEQAAADMLREALGDYTLDKLFEATILGEPKQVSRDDVSAKLSVTVKVAPNMQNWQKIYNRVTPVLQKVALKRTVFAGRTGGPECQDAKRRLAGEGIRIKVMKSLSRTGQNATWDAYLVPESLFQALQETLDQPYKLSVDLAGEGDMLIARVDEEPFRGYGRFSYETFYFYYLGPSALSAGGMGECAHHNVEVTMEVELAKLKQVTECVARIRDVSLDP